MIKNIGSADKILRLSLGLIIVILELTGLITGTSAVILGLVAAILILTGFVGVCPAYMLFHIRTNKKTS